MEREVVRTRRQVIALAGLGLLAASCGRGSPLDPAGDGPDLMTVDVARKHPPPGAPVQRVVDGATAFGHALVGSADQPNRNIVLSPLSIAYAFAMVRAGARGRTATEIDEVLHFPAHGRDQALNALTRDLVTTGDPPPRTSSDDTREPGAVHPPIVAIANAVFAQDSLPIKEAYLRVLAEQYGTGVRTLDFDSPEAAEQINAWVREQTAGRIEKLFDRIQPNIVMVLANAVYLKADWTASFSKRATGPADFTRLDGRVTSVPMMHRDEPALVAKGPGWRAVEVEYAGSELAMRILVPEDGRHPDTLLRVAALRTAGERLRQARVKLSMPRWNFSTDLDLESVLKRMGMSVPFDRTAADLTGIAELGGGRRLYIAQAVHRANISVDEWGTEAAAVTGVGMGATSAVPRELTFAVDRAFAFAIVHRSTGLPLFLGHVADPSAAGS